MSGAAVERMLPLYEAKMIHHYDHRWATFESEGSIRDVTLEEKADPDFVTLSRYWVREEVVADRLAGRDDPWMVGVRDITNSTNERTVICALFPRAGVGNNLPLILDAAAPSRLVAVLSSFALDFVARPKVGGVHLNFFIANQLPVIHPEVFEAPSPSGQGSLGDWVDARVGILTTWSGPGKRPQARAELDAAMFHLYGIERDDVDYIMETFSIVKRKDVAAHAEYRTKRLILEVYDQMADAQRTGTPYRSPIDEDPRP